MTTSDNIYVQSADLDGVALSQPFLAHKDLSAGRTLHFQMGPAPGTWAVQTQP